MVRCDKQLETLDIPREVWVGKTPEEQVNAIKNYVVAKWSGPYHRCAIRQNALVDYVESLPK